MFPKENIDTINRRLKDTFGLYADKVRYRVTWPNDEFEVRRVNHTEEGFQLIHPEFRKVHKYEKWRWDHWIIERLMEVPTVNTAQLAGASLSYEPLWTLDEKELAWPPIRFICQTVEDKIKNAQNGQQYQQYKHPYEGLTTEEQIQKHEQELKEIESYLYGNETRVTDALAYHGAIVVPTNYVGTDVRKLGQGEKNECCRKFSFWQTKSCN